MKEFEDKFGNIIEFPEEQKVHALGDHQEVEPFLDKIAEVLKDPDLVKRSIRKKDIFLYYRYYTEIYRGKYLLAVVKMDEKPPILLTFYITDRIKEGELIWKKN